MWLAVTIFVVNFYRLLFDSNYVRVEYNEFVAISL